MNLILDTLKCLWAFVQFCFGMALLALVIYMVFK